MVRAILDGRKTQTRPVIKPQPLDSWMSSSKYSWSEYYQRNRWGKLEKYLWISHPTENKEIVCPCGAPGDRLWVRETWYCAGEHECDGYPVRYREEAELVAEVSTSWRPPIFMPRWASRITLEIKSVRVERLREISEADAAAEGVDPFMGQDALAYRAAFQIGWNELNAKRGYSWESNPWVWVIAFSKL